jgi:RNA polymerase sigma-70 factor (ECF subfamily)
LDARARSRPLGAAERASLNESMRRLADGDRASFDEVFAALWPATRSFCARMLGDDADADDAAQQAIVSIFDRAACFDRDGDALSWAVAVAAFECRTLLKRRTRARRRGEADAHDLAAHTHDAPSPEDAVIARDLEDAAIDVLGALSDDDRATVRAAVTGERDPSVAPATFRKRKERAFDRLRAAWRKVHGP